ncbi:haloacid dehalogenase type II [Antrihabitans sp. YC2-6]|uniref:haloacid dehalogenase type II n=1 Tax=Antrihabitans sp. YC2-6 TaxID=2799498 RepID=UPI0018F2D957|nr:haloacid dehalogenase type II [Antrihabitans sp. YC2-6]MBJ8348183.1 haloacid dehalogenase type II [Antrihabitans sp. YC2-6]
MTKALLFDVQGTATDFFSTVRDEAVRIDAGRNPEIDWTGFVTRWRAAYFAGVAAVPVDSGTWTSVHSIYRGTLDGLLDEFAIRYSEPEAAELALAWQRLRPWPDAVPGLNRLRTRFTLATLSNADVSAVVNMSKTAGLPWDAIFTAEMAQAFKPDPAVYAMAATYLGLRPADIMMVASHKYDIRAAAALGFRTAFVARPLEFGPDGAVDLEFEDEFDINATDFEDLANKLDC